MTPLIGLSGFGGGPFSTLVSGSSPTSTAELRFKYYAYGATIGILEIYWDDGVTLNGPIPFIANGSSVSSISGQQQTATGQPWRDAVCNLGSYGGDTGRVVFKYITGSSFTGDIQLDAIELDHSGGTADLDPDLRRSLINNWEQSKSSTIYSSAIFSTVLYATSTTYFWNYDNNGTATPNTGNSFDSDGTATGYYLYVESSSPNSPSIIGWLRTINTYTL